MSTQKQVHTGVGQNLQAHKRQGICAKKHALIRVTYWGLVMFSNKNCLYEHFVPLWPNSDFMSIDQVVTRRKNSKPVLKVDQQYNNKTSSVKFNLILY